MHSFEPHRRVRRAAFLDALVHLVDPARTHFNKRCVSLRTCTDGSRSIELSFSDGTTAQADLVLGADGIRSVVRSHAVSDQRHDEDVADKSRGLVRAAFTNTIAYRGLVPNAKLKEKGVKTEMNIRPLCWCGPSKVTRLIFLPFFWCSWRYQHIITFPIKGGELVSTICLADLSTYKDSQVNVVAFVCDRTIAFGERPLPPGEAWVKPRTTEELLIEYEGWTDDVLKLLQCMNNPSVWSIHAVYPPLETYVWGRVALLGDAVRNVYT
jgi:salicylate hydroxylase